MILDRDFDRIASYFLRFFSKGSIRKMHSIRQSPAVRILETEKSERYVIKILREDIPGDKNDFHAWNEISMQNVLANLGFESKTYLLFFLNETNNPIGIPFTVSTYLPGKRITLKDLQDLETVVSVFEYLLRLHASDVRSNFGYTHRENLRSFGETETQYFFADMDRAGITIDRQRIITELNTAKLYCLNHWDITLKNTLIIRGDISSEIHLIDWAYAHYTEPSHDIANVVFWVTQNGMIPETKPFLLTLEERYREIGFEIASRLGYYLAQRIMGVGYWKRKFGDHGWERYMRAGELLLARSFPASLDTTLGVLSGLNL